jgi:hypothetical protein
MNVLDEVAVIKINPNSIRGKYKIGQNLKNDAKIELARKIFERNSVTSKNTLEVMGFSISNDDVKLEKDVKW